MVYLELIPNLKHHAKKSLIILQLLQNICRKACPLLKVFVNNFKHNTILIALQLSILLTLISYNITNNNFIYLFIKKKKWNNLHPKVIIKSKENLTAQVKSEKFF